MRNDDSDLALAAAAVLAGSGLFGDRPARAQNTYADVPFNQGSLFYRPSGAAAPTTTTAHHDSPPRHTTPAPPLLRRPGLRLRHASARVRLRGADPGVLRPASCRPTWC